MNCAYTYNIRAYATILLRYDGLMIQQRKMYNSMQQKRYVSVLLCIFALCLLVPPPAAQAELSNRSTNPTDVWSGGARGAVSHLIKKETVANVDTLKLRAYYPNNAYTRQMQGSDKYLTLRYGVAGKKCFIRDLNDGVPFRPNYGKVKVVIGESDSEDPNRSNARSNANTTRYNVPMSRVCNDDRNHNNAKAGRPGENRNDFFARYKFPNKLQYDEDLNLYYVNILIKYGNNVDTGGNTENSVNFNAFVTGSECPRRYTGREWCESVWCA